MRGGGGEEGEIIWAEAATGSTGSSRQRVSLLLNFVSGHWIGVPNPQDRSSAETSSMIPDPYTYNNDVSEHRFSHFH